MIKTRRPCLLELHWPNKTAPTKKHRHTHTDIHTNNLYGCIDATPYPLNVIVVEIIVVTLILSTAFTTFNSLFIMM